MKIIRLRGYSSLSVTFLQSSRNRNVGFSSAIAMPSSTITPSSGGTPFSTANIASEFLTSLKHDWAIRYAHPGWLLCDSSLR